MSRLVITLLDDEHTCVHLGLYWWYPLYWVALCWDMRGYETWNLVSRKRAIKRVSDLRSFKIDYTTTQSPSFQLCFQLNVAVVHNSVCLCFDRLLDLLCWTESELLRILFVVFHFCYSTQAMMKNWDCFLLKPYEEGLLYFIFCVKTTSNVQSSSQTSSVSKTLLKRYSSFMMMIIMLLKYSRSVVYNDVVQVHS